MSDHPITPGDRRSITVPSEDAPIVVRPTYARPTAAGRPVFALQLIQGSDAVMVTPADVLPLLEAMLTASGHPATLTDPTAETDDERAARERKEGIEALRRLMAPGTLIGPDPDAYRFAATRAYDRGARAGGAA